MGQELQSCSACLKKGQNEEFLANTGGTDVSPQSNPGDNKNPIKTKISNFKHLSIFNSIIPFAKETPQKNSEVYIQKMFRGFQMRKEFNKSRKELLIKEENEFISRTIAEYENKYNTLILDLNKIYAAKFSCNKQSKKSSVISKLIKCRLLIKHNENETTLYIGTTTFDLSYEGNGVLYSSKGFKYEGEFTNGELTGNGKMYYLDGDLIEGHFIKGFLEGEGKKVSLDLTVYNGNFIHSKREGEGTEESPEHIYTGQFKNDQKFGQGKVKYKLYKDVYQGEFKNNAINGYGLYIWENKHTYQGDFLNGKMHGKGVYKWPEGGEYDGEYVNGIKEGKGIFTWEDGRIFKGPFTKGKPNGKGILIINDIELEVEFNKGKILGNVKEMIAQQRKKNI